MITFEKETLKANINKVVNFNMKYRLEANRDLNADYQVRLCIRERFTDLYVGTFVVYIEHFGHGYPGDMYLFKQLRDETDIKYAKEFCDFLDCFNFCGHLKTYLYV